MSLAKPDSKSAAKSEALRAALGCAHPLIQAPMAGAQGSALAIAVSRAGGLGSMPAAMLAPQALRAELDALRASGQPYNLNFFAHTPPTLEGPQGQANQAALAAWHARLRPHFEALGLDAAQIPTGPGRRPFDETAAALVAEFRPRVVSFHFGLPAPHLLAQVKASGAYVLSSATTVDEALWLEAHGVDGVIAQGLEAGGHRGHFLSDDLTRQNGLFALLPQIVAAVRLPVIATGGIASAEGVRAALALGAAGVQIGSAYLCADEAATSALYRAALQSPAASHTQITTVMTGRPARGLPNRLMRELGPLPEGVPPFPLPSAAAALLRAAAEAKGSADYSFLWCGQNASACRPGRAADITAALLRGFAPA